MVSDVKRSYLYQLDQDYRSMRTDFLLNNEGFKSKVYLDTNGIGTVGMGMALITKNKKGLYVRNDTNFKIFEEALGVNSTEYKALAEFAKRNAKAINETPVPEFPKGRGKKTAKNFMLTQRGKAIVKEFGNLTNKWEVSDSPILSDVTAKSISSEALEAREKELDHALEKNGLGNFELTRQQRTAFLDATYHYGSASAKVKDGISAIKRNQAGGESLDQALSKAFTDKKYPDRSMKLNKLLKGHNPITAIGESQRTDRQAYKQRSSENLNLKRLAQPRTSSWPANHPIQPLHSSRPFTSRTTKGPVETSLTVASPPVSDASKRIHQQGPISVGQGQLSIEVNVSDERVTAKTNVLQQPDLIRLNAGTTHPAGDSKWVG